MIWKVIVEIITAFIPKKYRYQCRIRLRSIWNYLYVKSKVAKFSKGFQCGYDTPCSVSKYTYLEENVTLAGCYIMGSGKFCVGKNSHLGKDLLVMTDNHNYKGEALPFDKTNIKKDVIIGENCWVGTRVTLLPGTIIGDGVIIQAGSVVHGEIPPLAIIGGNPAKVFKYRDKEHYERLKAENKFIHNI